MIQQTQKPLNNLQLELLKIYSTGISDETLMELRKVIAHFLLERARDEADKVWAAKNYSEQSIEQWF